MHLRDDMPTITQPRHVSLSKQVFPKVTQPPELLLAAARRETLNVIKNSAPLVIALKSS